MSVKWINLALQGGGSHGALTWGAAALIHLIHVDAEVQDLAASSKMNAEAAYLDLLFRRGRDWAEGWLGAHFDDLGRNSTFDPGRFFDEPAWLGKGTRLAG